MKILKYLFFLILIAIIAGAIYVATKDGSYQIEETTIVPAPPSVVFDEVNNFQNWENWDPWNDEERILKFSDTLSGQGAEYSWTTENSGDGNIRTTGTIPHSSIEQDLILDSEFGESESEVYWEFEEVEGGTQVTWGIQGEQSFKEKLASTFKEGSYSEFMRPQLAEGLEDLKEEIRTKMDVYTINVDGTTTHGGGFYMYTTTASKINQIQEKRQQMYTEVINYMDNNNITALGNPFVLYNQWDEGNNSAIYSVGVFTPSLVITPSESEVLNGMMPMQQVIKTTLKGDYKYLRGAWDRANNYITENNLQVSESSQSFEVYKTGPDKTPNPAEWITEIYIPVEPKAVPLNIE